MKLLTTIILFLLATQAHAEITAHLSRNPVSLNESFHLVYEADSNVDDPDFSVLNKDFEILSSSQSTNMRSINGNWSLKKSWDLSLISKQAGVFTIPPVPFGNELAPSIQVTVKTGPIAPAPGAPSTGTQAGANGELFLETEVDRRSAYVQSQILYTVRLVRTVDINNATLTDPVTSDSDALIEKLGEDVSYQRTRNGVRYHVIERRYAIFPQHSGDLEIQPVTFKGRVLTRSSRRPRSVFDSFMNMDPGAYRQVRSEARSVQIRPRPDGVDAASWLPAKDMNLIQQWSDDITQLRAGEPVTRTLTLTADGLLAEQLPEIDIPEIDGIKQYPDQPVLENAFSADGVRGTREIKIAMIPTRKGSFTIPETTLTWWNTASDTAETITLPPTTLTAVAAAPGMQNTVQPAPLSDVKLARPGAQQASGGAASKETSAVPVVRNRWFWVSLALAVGWLLTTLFLLAGRRPAEARRPEPVAAPDPAPARRAVLAAIDRADGPAAKQALIRWGQALWPADNIHSLADVARRAARQDPVLAERINALSASLYSRNGDWKPNELKQAFRAFKPSRDDKNLPGRGALQPLFRF